MRIENLLAQAFVASMLVVAASAAYGQVTRQSSGGSAGAQQLQQLAAERTALQAENAKLKQELAALKSSSSAGDQKKSNLDSRAARAEAATARALAEKTAADRSAADARARTDELVVKFRELAQTLRGAETEKAAATARADAANRDLDRCAQQNVELATIALDVLQRYENVGLGQVLARSEPFAQLTRTRVENLVDEYRIRVQELKTPERAAADVNPPVR
jgi:chromosome segregation ATPase